jgi:hypothetical protein
MAEILGFRQQAQSLRRLIGQHQLDIELIAHDSALLFGSAGHPAQTRWLEFELRGYASTFAELPDALGVSPVDPLLLLIKSYRVQAVRALYQGRPPLSSHHFFVEALGELVAAQGHVRSLPGPVFRLDFIDNAGHPELPYAGETDRFVFDRILLGFRAALHLQLGHVAQ